MPWSAPFDEPIRLRGGRKLTTLQQAADYIMKLPEGERRRLADVCADWSDAGTQWRRTRALTAVSFSARSITVRHGRAKARNASSR
jgi:hypothetical protein